jgi:hypothetical protein
VYEFTAPSSRCRATRSVAQHTQSSQQGSAIEQAENKQIRRPDPSLTSPLHLPAYLLQPVSDEVLCSQAIALPCWSQKPVFRSSKPKRCAYLIQTVDPAY